MAAGDADLNEAMLMDLLNRVGSEHRWVHVERLAEFNSEPSYTRVQGEE